MRQLLVRLMTLFMIALLCGPAQLRAQDNSAPPNFNGFDGFVEQVMKDWKVPGLAVAVVKDGKVIYAKGFGYRDVQKGLKVTPDTLFAIGSCSKAFTATAMAILVDEGKLDWDKPVRNYLPDLTLHDGYATEHIRPRDLVTHQSGLPRHDMVWYGSPLSRKEIFERLRYLEPSQPLHAKFLPRPSGAVAWRRNRRVHFASSFPAQGSVGRGGLNQFVVAGERPHRRQRRGSDARSERGALGAARQGRRGQSQGGSG